MKRKGKEHAVQGVGRLKVKHALKDVQETTRLGHWFIWEFLNTSLTFCK